MSLISPEIRGAEVDWTSLLEWAALLFFYFVVPNLRRLLKGKGAEEQDSEAPIEALEGDPVWRNKWLF